MPKSMTIAPQQVRQGGWLETAPVPLNQYQPDPHAERERWGSAALRDVHRDMVMIRAFETMLGDIKTQGAYRGIAYEHPGGRAPVDRPGGGGGRVVPAADAG